MDTMRPGNAGRSPIQKYYVTCAALNWQNLLTVSRFRAQRIVGEEDSSEDRYHIAIITRAKQVLWAVRSHWGIENELHWSIDIGFNECHCRVRKDYGPENFAILRHMALNLLKHKKPASEASKANAC